MFQLHSTFEHKVTSVSSYLCAVHLNREPNLESKMLSTPKLKQFQDPKVGCEYLLLGAMFPPNFMRFRCMVLENGIETFPHTICSGDVLYHACTFSMESE